MHGLKCAICGKEYFYESKICRECEEYAIYSGLTKSEIFVEASTINFYKWNCDRFIHKGTIPIIRSGSKRIDFCITKEPRNYKNKGPTHYFWNSDSAIKLRACLEESIEKVRLDIKSKIVDDFMEFFKERTDSLLTYE